MRKQAGGYSQCRVRVIEMEGEKVLDTVWLIYKCFTRGGAVRESFHSRVYHRCVQLSDQ